MPLPLKNKAGETTWSEVSKTILGGLFSAKGVLEAELSVADGRVEVELLTTVDGAGVLLEYLE